MLCLQVAGNKFIFGAFTPLSWPADAASKGDWLACLCGHTFLFSLVNAHGRPVKLRLKAGERGKALSMKGSGYGPGFSGGADVRLMWGQLAANQPQGCLVKPHSFEVDPEAEREMAAQPLPAGYDRTLLAGDDGAGGPGVHFAAAEIEVYQV